MKKLLFLSNLVFITLLSRAQVTQQQVTSGVQQKYHYILHHVSDIDSVKLYNTALSKINLDEYRLLNKRRTISFDTGVQVELLSAKELKDMYGKPVSPLNSKNGSPVIFYIKPNETEILVK